MRGRMESESQADPTLSTEPNGRLHLKTLRSGPEPKEGRMLDRLHHPGVQVSLILVNKRTTGNLETAGHTS